MVAAVTALDEIAGERRGDWIQTASGRQFWPLDPRPEDIHIEDIAHALAHLCRYGGHARRFYSVAEHSVLMARAMQPEHRLWALLHDAAEAYLVDVPRPIKPFLPGYAEIEGRIMGAICARFGLAVDMPPEIKAADRAILTDEMRQAMAPPPVRWSTEGEPLGVTLKFWPPDDARMKFLLAFERLDRAAQEATDAP